MVTAPIHPTLQMAMMVMRRAVMSLLILILLLLCVNVDVVNVDDRKRDGALGNFLRQKGISLLHQNVRGLLHNFTAIEELLYTNKDIDILTLSETHICATEDNDKLYHHVQGYNFEKRNRLNGKGGGVALYVKDSVNYIRRTDLESKTLENIVIEKLF